ncbi:MAG: hypothetical protein GY765_12045 [bacterium]|nr:hypothetical protein [bacterium]
MKKVTIYVVLFCTILAAGILGVMSIQASNNALEMKISKVKEQLFAPCRNQHNCIEGFHNLLDAIAINLPKAGHSAELKGKIMEARKLIKGSGIFNPTASKYLKEAYKEMNNGKAFTVKKDCSVEKILASGEQWLADALVKASEGKYADSTKLLMRTAVLIITPVKHPGGCKPKG